MLNVLKFLQSENLKKYDSIDIQLGIIVLIYQTSKLHKQIDEINSTYEKKRNELRKVSSKYLFDAMRNEKLISETQYALKEMLQTHNPEDSETAENQKLTPRKFVLIH